MLPDRFKGSFCPPPYHSLRKRCRLLRNPPLAQLVRAPSLYLGGSWFESKGADYEIALFQMHLLAGGASAGGEGRMAREVGVARDERAGFFACGLD